MTKRMTDITIWKKQRWFKKLSPIHKLAVRYLTDACDHAGMWKIDMEEFFDDIGLEPEDFVLKDFLKKCNSDTDKYSGEQIDRDRILVVENKYLWLTGFIKFQYQGKDRTVNPASLSVDSAFKILDGFNLLRLAIELDYFYLPKPLYENGKPLSRNVKPLIDLSYPLEAPQRDIITITITTVFKSLNTLSVYEDNKLSSCGSDEEKKNEEKKPEDPVQEGDRSQEQQPQDPAPPPKRRAPRHKPDKTLEQQLRPLIKNLYLSWYEDREERPFQWAFGKHDQFLNKITSVFLNYAKHEFQGTNPTDDVLVTRAKNIFDSMLQDWDKLEDQFLARTDICNITSSINNIISTINSKKNGRTINRPNKNSSGNYAAGVSVLGRGEYFDKP